ncbi:hypothetical protein CRE_06183 [Caenorhabditis remanei]|uniref:Uncharacterized protein n=1 Tax=Caenorhabditis remanei TaxID=31234 RepID=E3NKP5_CAERE|nr:hypothetical protein CRE_06183 [Caenorhabditis remanei]
MSFSDPEDPRSQRIFLIRHLNDATKSCLKLSYQSSFRPTYTIFPYLDETSQNAADKLAEDVYRNKKDFLDNITVLGLVALVSTNSDLYFKVPVVNLAIKWLLLNPLPDETLHSVLSSINIHCIPFPKLARVRIAIYLYLKTPELYTYFDINFAAPGVVFIRRKSGIPNDSEEYNDQEKMWIYKAINSITDGYVNPSYPQGTRRNDPDGVKPKSGKLKYTEQFADVAKELENPIFKWDFENKGTAYVHKEPVVQDPLTAPHPMEFAPPRRGFVEYYSPKKEENKVEEKRIEKSPPKSPQQLAFVPPVVQNESVRKARIRVQMLDWYPIDETKHTYG